jgi:glycosyltransferase involved in cell wall biosynthesis
MLDPIDQPPAQNTEHPMKVLFLCNHTSAIHSGSHQRLRHLLKAIAAVGELTLVYPIAPPLTDPDVEALQPFCKKIYTFPLASLAYQRDPCLPRPLFWTKHKLRYLHPVDSALMQQMRSEEANALVAGICSQRFDLIWCQKLSSIQMLPPSPGARVIVDLDDVEHRKLHAQLELWKDPPHMLPLYWFEFFKLKKLERSLRKLPYEFAVCSEIDRKVIGRDASAWVIPNGIDIPAAPASSDPDKSDPTLLFVGLMSYEPNADAALFFAQRVLPLIQRQVPAVKFLIVGRDPTLPIRQLHNGKSIFVTGTVPDVSEYLLKSSVVVVPLRFGGGTRIKILEALAHRKAVVSTTIGAEGIEAQPGKHLLRADSAEDFAQACTLALKDRCLRNRLGEAGFELVRDRYQWKGIERMIGEIVLGRAVATTCEV